MRQESLFDVILGPYISEKSTMNYEKNKTVVLKVRKCATKNEIKQAVEKCLDVQVEAVQVCNVKGKKKYFRQIEGRRKSWKKAYVVLKDGFSIDIMTTE